MLLNLYICNLHCFSIIIKLKDQITMIQIKLLNQ